MLRPPVALPVGQSRPGAFAASHSQGRDSPSPRREARPLRSRLIASAQGPHVPSIPAHISAVMCVWLVRLDARSSSVEAPYLDAQSSIITTNGANTSSARAGWPRRFVLLSQVNK